MKQPDIDYLFLRTLDDLRERAKSSDPYTVLLIAFLLRKLFFESAPLVDQANRPHKLKLCFTVGNPGAPMPGDSFYAVVDGIDPDTCPPLAPPLTVNKDALFTYPLLFSNGVRHNLREVILFEANVMGAVHPGSAKAEKERALEEIGKYFGVAGLRCSLYQLKGISRVVLKGLEPLAIRVRG